MWLIASMSENTPQTQDKFIVRLPDGMRDHIKAKAAKNNRSMNAEIVHALEEHLRPRFIIDMGDPNDYTPADARAELVDEGPPPPPVVFSPEMKRALQSIVGQVQADLERRINDFLWMNEAISEREELEADFGPPKSLDKND
ncbi:Arc family DNA-binding protein [Tropicimonas aquimaris]|uniref:Arc family DNA-binding protein n=1 Tax=Tropicimonas aquimaris TaxID=914152 RepID=A0ABW3IJV8_9RHOB